MKLFKKLYRGIFMLCLMVAMVVLPACSLQKKVNITSITIDADTMPEYVVIGQFDEANIKATITYSDGSTEELAITESLLQDYYLDLIATPGTHEIEILFKNETLTFKVKMVNADSLYTVKFFNGYNELVSMQIVESGKDAVAPRSAHYIQGYDFVGWDRSFNDVTENINVYGIYTTSSSSADESVYKDKLFDAIAKMKDGGRFNTIEINEIPSQAVGESVSGLTSKAQATYYYINNDAGLMKATRSEIMYDSYGEATAQHTAYYYIKDPELGNTYKKYTFVNGGRSEEDISYTNFENADILYSLSKNMISNQSSYSATLSAKDSYYTMLSKIRTDSQFDYEIVYNEDQILWAKVYNVIESSNDFSRELISSIYFVIDDTCSDEVLLPDDIDVLQLLSILYDNDVVITTETATETGLEVSEVLQHDADSNACKANDDYKWISNQRYFYTAKNNENRVVYEGDYSSDKMYKNVLYSETKTFISSISSPAKISVDANGGVHIRYLTDSDTGLNTWVEYVVRGNKLAEIIHYSEEHDELINVFKKITFVYKDVEVNVPQEYKSQMDSATPDGTMK